MQKRDYVKIQKSEYELTLVASAHIYIIYCVQDSWDGQMPENRTMLGSHQVINGDKMVRSDSTV